MALNFGDAPTWGDTGGDGGWGSNPYQNGDVPWTTQIGQHPSAHGATPGWGTSSPNVTQQDSSYADAARRQQDLILQQLQQYARGDMNSWAQQQLRGQYDAAANAQQALASSQRGVGAGAQMMQAQQGQSDVMRGLAGQQHMLMLQQQQGAQQLLAQQLAAQQGQDITGAQNSAQNSLMSSQLQNQMQQFLAQQQSQALLNQYNNAFGLGAAQLGFNLQQQGLNTQLGGQIAQGIGGLAGTGMNIWGQNQNPFNAAQYNPSSGIYEMP